MVEYASIKITITMTDDFKIKLNKELLEDGKKLLDMNTESQNDIVDFFKKYNEFTESVKKQIDPIAQEVESKINYVKNEVERIQNEGKKIEPIPAIYVNTFNKLVAKNTKFFQIIDGPERLMSSEKILQPNEIIDLFVNPKNPHNLQKIVSTADSIKVAIRQMLGLHEFFSDKNSKLSKIQERKVNIDLTISSWNKLTIRFLNRDEVLLEIADSNGKITRRESNYDILGFKNNKNGNPDEQWFFLRLLGNDDECRSIKRPLDDKTRKKKNKLTKRLQTIFNNNTDPFDDYKFRGKFKLKLNIVLEDY